MLPNSDVPQIAYIGMVQDAIKLVHQPEAHLVFIRINPIFSQTARLDIAIEQHHLNPRLCKRLCGI